MTDTAVDYETLRPRSWDDYIGQDPIKLQLAIRAEDAFQANESFPHTLLTGPPGTGKTTLAMILANRLGDEPFYNFVMPMDPRILVNLINSPRWGGGIIALDELHSASTRFQEMLLPLMHEGYLMVNGRRIEAPWTTIVGMTTDEQKLLPALKSRFRLEFELDDYADEELALIILGQAERIGAALTDDDAVALGRATGGIPRTGGDLVYQARALSRHLRRPATAAEVLASLRIDGDGVTVQHRRYLETLEKLGGVAGLENLRNVLQLHANTVRDLERLLFRLDLITFTDRGREITAGGIAKLHGDQPRRQRMRRVS